MNVNGFSQNCEKNFMNNQLNNSNEFFTSSNPKIKKQVNYQNFIQLNKTNKNMKKKINNIIPLGNLLKQIGEAISQNQTNQNIANLINRIPNSNSNSKNNSYKYMRK